MYAKKIKQKKFSWGAIALATPFPSRDVATIVGSIAGGSRFWGSSELADIHAQMLLEGTKSKSKKDIQNTLDSIGATLSFTSGSERLYFTGSVRPVHLQKLLNLVAECLQESTFPEPELAALKMREASNLELEEQNTNTQAGIGLSRLLFKEGHPNYSETTAESKAALKVSTAHFLREKHSKLIDARSLILSVAGDIKPQKVFALTQSIFKLLPKNSVQLPKIKVAKVERAQKTSVTIPNKASIDYMVGVATGISNIASDYPALLLSFNILGRPGGFVGRLMNTVREEEGLTYGIYAYAAGFKNKVDGYLYVWATFAPQLFEKGKTSIQRQLKLLIEKGVAEEEVTKHKNLFVARTKVQLSNSAAFAKVAHDTIADNKPLSHIDEFPKKILKLKAADVNKALKKYLVLNKLSESAAGPM